MAEKPARNLGQYYRSGDWSDYWRTAVSYVGPHELLIRGYPIEEIVAESGRSERAVYRILAEVRQHLKDLLELAGTA